MRESLTAINRYTRSGSYIIALIATLALPIAPTPCVVAAALDRASTPGQQLGNLINDYRKQHGLQPLEPAAMLSELAREHAARMARDNRLSHDGFEQRLAKTRAPRCVENVGDGYETPPAAFDAWRNSPVHDRNLLDPKIRYMGLAIERGYVAFFACG